ncbi:MAG: 2Fe-2S iron-sulfur cluster-binding protein [Desulfobacterales bacterium]|jgi:predicted molibdopterin-dependent oxidoreductase YjgC|nr:2Fe-2S iron-sulfur cluster-binding protein [Desulfobacterales bacterium]
MPVGIRIIVDGRDFDVEPGANLLAACLAAGIYIPHLCYLEDMKPAAASCRLCFVDIEGRKEPVPACTVTVDTPLEVDTGSPAVRRLQKAGLQLLLSVHRVACKNCPAHRRCDLQRIAKFLKVGLTPGNLDRYLKEPEVDSSHPCLDYYPNRCVLCGRCVHVCRRQHTDAVLTFAKRGFATVVRAYDDSPAASDSCRGCRACADACPVAALLPKHP